MSIDRGSVRSLVRAIAYDARGSRLGRVAQVFIDDRTDEPAWVAVDVTRTRGMRLLPLAGAGFKGRYLVIRAERSTVRSAPRIDLGDGQLSSQDESRLLEHYGLTSADAGEMPQTAEYRPASPWPDDTERETAWERPAQPSYVGDDTQAMSRGWEQQPTANEQTTEVPPADKPVTETPVADQPAADQPSHGPGASPDRDPSPDQRSADHGTAPGVSPARNRDTEPTPVTPAPSPPLGATPPRPDPEPQGSSPAAPTR